MIVATHLIDEMDKMFDDIILMKGGRLVKTCSCEDLREKYGKTPEQLLREI